MITRRGFIGSLAGGLLAGPLAAEAQPARVYRVGVVLQGGPYFAAIDGLRDGLRELGLEEGKQFVLHVPLRIELRRLRSLKLIGMRGDHRVGEGERAGPEWLAAAPLPHSTAGCARKMCGNSRGRFADRAAGTQGSPLCHRRGQDAGAQA